MVSPAAIAADAERDAEPLRDAAARTRLRDAVRRAATFLPVQAPLEVFVHLNPLVAFQGLPFHAALAAAREKLGVRGYLPEERYREALARGRIRDEDLRAELAWLELPRMPAGLPDAAILAELVMRYPIPRHTESSLRFLLDEQEGGMRLRDDLPEAARRRLVAETRARLEGELSRGPDERPLYEIAATLVGREEDPVGTLARHLGIVPTRAALRRTLREHPDWVAAVALWTACRELTRGIAREPAALPRARFPRELLLEVCPDDANDLVHPVLVPLAAAFLDRGQASLAMPLREHGFYEAFRTLMTTGKAVRPSWLYKLGRRLRSWTRHGVDAEGAILEILLDLGIADEDVPAFVESTLLQLRGFAGMFARIEGAPGLAPSRTKVSLMDFLAVRLTHDLFAFEDIAARLGYRGPLRHLGAFCRALPPLREPVHRGDHDLAYPAFQLAQLAGLSAPALRAVDAGGARALLELLDALPEATRLRVFHDAYERRPRDEALRAIAAALPCRPRSERPTLQVLMCLDDRCESLRRHIEEVIPDAETYGAPGFFNLAIAYQGLDDPSTFPLCPIVVKAAHRVAEEPLAEHRELAEVRKRRLARLSRLAGLFDRASRSLLLGPVVTALSGLLVTVPLLATVFAPFLASRLRKVILERLIPKPRTRLADARDEAMLRGAEGAAAEPPTEDGVVAGFSVEEEATRVATLFENLGLTSRFGRFVLVLGHDSTSSNNPHAAAYACAACGGRSGGPNARLFARIANREAVRTALKARGLALPDETLVVGGLHDTCADTITLFDLDGIPAERRAELEGIVARLDEARGRNAIERCRRFAAAPKNPTGEDALRHVAERGEDLSQVRQELGHQTNACCIVGRRGLSRGLFFDRRALLVSYDATSDPEGAILERVLTAVAPVGAGISLDYYFSTVDQERLGAGTKLPHNVTALVGVMNGAASDLRNGLPKQMVEIHEPLRLHLVLEARAAVVEALLARQEALRTLIECAWVRLSTVDPESGAISIHLPGEGLRPYRPPPGEVRSAASSAACYAGYGQFEHIPPTRIVAAESARAIGGAA